MRLAVCCRSVLPLHLSFAHADFALELVKLKFGKRFGLIEMGVSIFA